MEVGDGARLELREWLFLCVRCECWCDMRLREVVDPPHPRKGLRVLSRAAVDMTRASASACARRRRTTRVNALHAAASDWTASHSRRPFISRYVSA